ncbi:MAG: hypothetical protein AVDCRST_MAG88-1561, partial [uncultured Thermomicrobiales bacterium]
VPSLGRQFGAGRGRRAATATRDCSACDHRGRQEHHQRV